MPRPRKDIGELFCYAPDDSSDNARQCRIQFRCPVINSDCTKNNDDLESDPVVDGKLGVCSVLNPQIGETVICPVRLYSESYKSIKQVALALLLRGEESPAYMYLDWIEAGKPSSCVVLLGQGHGGELTTPVGHIDWTGVLLDAQGDLQSFCWIEVQAIDTTGNYRDNRRAYLKESLLIPSSKHGLNWENVNKRIIPQLIRKGKYLIQNESVPQSGLGFIVDANVFAKFQERLGAPLVAFPTNDPDADFLITAWSLEGQCTDGQIRRMRLEHEVWSSVASLCDSFLEAPPWDESVMTSIRCMMH